MKIIKVLVVDDSQANRDLLTGILESSPYITVAGTACDGREAIEKVGELKPDILTLDLEMPKMDGLTFLRLLMNSSPLPVIVISSRTDYKSMIRALEYGAVDFLPKPVSPGQGVEELRRVLLEKVRTFAPVEMKKVVTSVDLLEESKKALSRKTGGKGAKEAGPKYEVVVIGASTGGPPAIQAIISKLPAVLPAAVAVSQHMPPKFTRFFAERLGKLSALQVREAEDGDLLAPGSVLISPGGYHMTFEKAGGRTVVRLKAGRAADKYVPSVDVMMRSAVDLFGPAVMGVVLTGMGNDGTQGLSDIRGAGGLTLAESDKTAVIYGMPKAAVNAGVVDKVLPLGEMADEIISLCG